MLCIMINLRTRRLREYPAALCYALQPLPARPQLLVLVAWLGCCRTTTACSGRAPVRSSQLTETRAFGPFQQCAAHCGGGIVRPGRKTCPDLAFQWEVARSRDPAEPR
jgi:hypothetical protein